MGFMDKVTTGKIVRPRRVMIYGVHGIGKSTWASMAPDPVFIDMEDGLADIDCARVDAPANMTELRELFNGLYRDEHNFKTVVVDSLDWLERMIWEDTSKEHGKSGIEDFGYGKGYVHALENWRKFIVYCNTLRNKRGMTVILTAHSQIKKFEEPGLDTYDRYQPKLHDKAAALVQEFCDEVFFANYKKIIRKTDEGFNRKRNVALGQGERVLYTTERPGWLAKNRLSLPDELPMKWPAFAEHLPAAEKKTATKRTKAKEATDEVPSE